MPASTMQTQGSTRVSIEPWTKLKPSGEESEMGGAPTSSCKIVSTKQRPLLFCADSANTAKMEDANCKQWHEINKNADWMK